MTPKSMCAPFWTVLLVLFLQLIPARAWSPDTHMALFDMAARDALEDGRVTLYVVDYDQGSMLEELGQYQVADEVLEALRKAPQQFRAGLVGPDAYPTWAAGQQSLHRRAGDWLNFLWEQAHTPQFRSPEVLAFVYGMMAHAAGDAFCHTLLYEHSRGGITAEQLSLESHISRHTPVTEKSISIAGLEDFIFRRMIWDDPSTPAGRRLRALHKETVSLPAALGGSPTSEATQAALRALPSYSHRLAQALVSPPTVDLTQLKAVADEYQTRYLGSLPAGLVPVQAQSNYYLFLVKSALGMEPMEFGRAVSTSPSEILGPEFKLRSFDYYQMGLGEGQGAFELERFPSAYNTVVLNKLLLLDQKEFNRVLSDLGSQERLREANVMLGWLGDLNAANAWSKGSIFSQDKVVFRRLFRFHRGAQHVSSPIRVIKVKSGGAVGGEPATVRITLNRVAPPGGVRVSLVTPLESHVSLPHEVMVEKGQKEIEVTTPTRRVRDFFEIPLTAAVSGVAGPECLIVLRPRGSAGMIGQPVEITPTDSDNSNTQPSQALPGPLDVTVEGPREVAVGEPITYKARIRGGQVPYKIEWVIDGHNFEEEEVAGCFYETGSKFVILRVYDQGDYKETPRLLRIRVRVVSSP